MDEEGRDAGQRMVLRIACQPNHGNDETFLFAWKSL